jgi:hypothetical protein
MPAPALDQFTVIVRHCGERTTDACVELLAQFAPGKRIHRVSARPFGEVLRQSLELGLAEGRPWTLCIDADVLILPGLADFLAAAESFPAGLFEAQALVLDKLLPARRPAGNHLYRSELIAQALPRIPVGDSLRPESDMILAMAALGYRAHQSSLLVGLHDFEQAYQDIYLKAFLHAHKHRFIAPLLRSLWEALGREDDDFRVALAALEDGLQHDASPQLSRDFREQPIEEALAAMKLVPKRPLAAVAPAQVAAMLRAATAMSQGDMRSLVDEIQAKIDAAVFPSLAARGAALLAGIAGTLPWRKNR